jgi:hypothetical protein
LASDVLANSQTKAKSAPVRRTVFPKYFQMGG